jgi:hypothetical protein
MEGREGGAAVVDLHTREREREGGEGGGEIFFRNDTRSTMSAMR